MRRLAGQLLDSVRLSLNLLVVSSLSLVPGCATTEAGRNTEYPASHVIMGKTKQEVAACAGAPVKELEQDDVVEWIYYKEASLLEESFPGSKSSIANIHHGCRANIQFKSNRVIGVRYQSIPDSYHDEGHCDEIFERCPMVESRP